MFNSFNYYKSKIKYGNKRLEDSTWIYVLSEGFGYLGSLPYKKNGDAAVVAVVAVVVYFCLASSQEQLILPQIILVTML